MTVDNVSLKNYFIQQTKLSGREAQVYSTLRLLGESTSWDLLNVFGWSNPNLVRPRLNNLESKGLIEKVRQVKVNGILQWTWRVVKSVDVEVLL